MSDTPVGPHQILVQTPTKTTKYRIPSRQSTSHHAVAMLKQMREDGFALAGQEHTEDDKMVVTMTKDGANTVITCSVFEDNGVEFTELDEVDAVVESPKASIAAAIKSLLTVEEVLDVINQSKSFFTGPTPSHFDTSSLVMEGITAQEVIDTPGFFTSVPLTFAYVNTAITHYLRILVDKTGCPDFIEGEHILEIMEEYMDSVVTVVTAKVIRAAVEEVKSNNIVVDCERLSMLLEQHQVAQKALREADDEVGDMIDELVDSLVAAGPDETVH